MRAKLIQSLLETILAEIKLGGIFLADFSSLHLHCETPADAGTLPLAAQMAKQYTGLKPGEVTLLSDPFAGGSHLSQMSFVVSFKGVDKEPWILVTRQGFRPVLKQNPESIDEEGLRIPPMPITQNWQLGAGVMEAIEQHPLCPDGFGRRVLAEIEFLKGWVKKTQALLSHYEKVWGLGEADFRIYLEATEAELKEKLVQELTHAETERRLRLDSGEIIKLQAMVYEGGFKFDFQGTSSSKHLCLTSAATFGAVASAVAAFMDFGQLLNEGLFRTIEVSTPLGSMLNAKYPSPIYKGHTDGASLIAELTLQALRDLKNEKALFFNSPVPVKVFFEFPGKRVFFDALYGGLSASGPGCEKAESSSSFWTRPPLESSVEEIESLFPLRILRIEEAPLKPRPENGKTHGRGLLKEYEFLEKAHLTWSLGLYREKAEGQDSGKLGPVSPELFLIPKNETTQRELTSLVGSLELQPGDKLIVQSAQGYTV